MKPLFVVDRIDTATLMASAGSDAAYPITNLQDGRYSTQWKSGNYNEDLTLQFVFPIARQCNSLLIVNNNFSSLYFDNILFECSLDNGATWFPVATVAPYPNLIFITGFNYSSNYFQLKFYGPSVIGNTPMIGMIFLGSYVELPGVLNKSKKNFTTETDLDFSLSGLPFATQTAAGRYNRKFVPDALKTSEETQFIRLLNTVSNRLHPFFMRDTDGKWNFVRIEQDAVEWSNWSKIRAIPSELSLVGELPGVQFIS